MFHLLHKLICNEAVCMTFMYYYDLWSDIKNIENEEYNANYLYLLKLEPNIKLYRYQRDKISLTSCLKFVWALMQKAVSLFSSLHSHILTQESFKTNITEELILRVLILECHCHGLWGLKVLTWFKDDIKITM